MAQRLRSMQDGNIKNLMSNTVECIYKHMIIYYINFLFFSCWIQQLLQMDNISLSNQVK